MLHDRLYLLVLHCILDVEQLHIRLNNTHSVCLN